MQKSEIKLLPDITTIPLPTSLGRESGSNLSFDLESGSNLAFDLDPDQFHLTGDRSGAKCKNTSAIETLKKNAYKEKHFKQQSVRFI